MKTSEMIKDYFFRAKWCLKEAEMALSEKNNPMCIRRSQEALELITKALLRSMAIEYPREHDVRFAGLHRKKTSGVFEIRAPFVKKSFD